MKKKLLLLLLSLFSILFFSCDQTTTSSSEGNILSFSIDGNGGAAAIDSKAGTVVIEVPPMDIRGIDPEIGLSAGSKLVEKPELKDGESLKFVVEAEDGTRKDWMVTVNVLPGASFTLDGKDYLYLKGATHSDPNRLDELGNGVPLAQYKDSIYFLLIGNELTDLTTPPRPGDIALHFSFVATEKDRTPIITNREYTLSELDEVWMSVVVEDPYDVDDPRYVILNSSKITFISLSTATGETFKAVFSGQVDPYGPDDGPVPIEGFIKVIHTEATFLAH